MGFACLKLLTLLSQRLLPGHLCELIPPITQPWSPCSSSWWSLTSIPGQAQTHSLSLSLISFLGMESFSRVPGPPPVTDHNCTIQSHQSLQVYPKKLVYPLSNLLSDFMSSDFHLLFSWMTIQALGASGISVQGQCKFFPPKNSLGLLLWSFFACSPLLLLFRH